MTSPHSIDERSAPTTTLLLLAFAAVYIIWGSTYLAIRIAVQTLPPLTMAGVRFALAGAIMYGWFRGRAVRPTRVQWRAAAIVGTLMLLGGNGAVVWAETTIDSNVAALLVATVPLWLVVIGAVRPSGVRPNWADVAGLLAGFVGVYLLLAPAGEAAPATQTASATPAASAPQTPPTAEVAEAAHAEHFAVHPLGAGLVIFASFSWALGSLYSRRAPLPKHQGLATAMEMLTGGAVLLIGGALSGEWTRVDPATFSWQSLTALGYLIAFGSIVAFSAYMWLLQVSTPARVGTYAFVNPVVAVFLGWLILSEPIGPNTVGAMVMIVSGVVVTTLWGQRGEPRRRADEIARK